jgi:hypothetical protein
LVLFFNNFFWLGFIIIYPIIWSIHAIPNFQLA